MGTKNKQRRQAKAKQRAEEARRRASRASSAWGSAASQSDRERPGGEDVQAIRDALWTVTGLRRGDGSAAWRAIYTAEPAVLGAQAEVVIEQIVARLWGIGWQPAELVRNARRSEARLGRVVAQAVVNDHTRRDRRTIHPLWVAQVDEIAGVSARPGWLIDLVDSDTSVTAASLTQAVMESLRLLGHVGPLPTILPPPGSDPDTWDRGDDAPATDDPVLAKVRALLAQAESTTFEAEAETFMAKAQELIARHAIDTALLWSKSARTTRPVTIRLPIDDPYIDQKSLLLHLVAESSQCRAVLHPSYALMSVVGFAADVAAAEMLYTSLLVQSQAAMQAEVGNAPPGARVRGRSFRSSFLQAYAHRVGTRLADINQTVQDAVESEHAALPAAEVTSLLPALVAREEAIDTEVGELFGELKKQPFKRTYDALGWTRGDLAGERAELNPSVFPGGASRARTPQPAQLAPGEDTLF